MAVAAACFRAKPAGYRRTSADRGRGRASPFSAADLAAVFATCHRPRRRGRGVESDQVAAERGRLDAVIAGLPTRVERGDVTAEHDGATQPGDHALRVTSWNCSRGADVSRRGRQGPIIRI